MFSTEAVFLIQYRSHTYKSSFNPVNFNVCLYWMAPDRLHQHLWEQYISKNMGMQCINLWQLIPSAKKGNQTAAAYSHMLCMTTCTCTMINLGQRQAVWQQTECSRADNTEAISLNLGLVLSLLRSMYCSCLSQCILMKESAPGWPN